MSEFSTDCQLWWDGERWIPIAAVVIPASIYEQTYQSATYRTADRQSGWAQNIIVVALLLAATIVGSSITLCLMVPLLVLVRRARNNYRLWTLEQIALATTYLVGSDEPMLAGESDAAFRGWLFPGPNRSMAQAMTARHILTYVFDSFMSPPRLALVRGRLT